MENILNTIFNTENVRTLVMIVSIFSCFVWLKTSIKNLEHKMESSINELRGTMDSRMNELKYKDLAHLESSLKASINELKYNDFAHLMNAFVALTYVLEKNHILSKEDKEYVDSRF